MGSTLCQVYPPHSPLPNSFPPGAGFPPYARMRKGITGRTARPRRQPHNSRAGGWADSSPNPAVFHYGNKPIHRRGDLAVGAPLRAHAPAEVLSFERHPVCAQPSLALSPSDSSALPLHPSSNMELAFEAMHSRQSRDRGLSCGAPTHLAAGLKGNVKVCKIGAMYPHSTATTRC